MEPVGTVNFNELPPLNSETAQAMRSEFSVSFLLAVIYFTFLMSVTILNFTAPDFMKTILWGGMTVTWFATAILALVMATLIAWLHVLYYQKKLAENAKVREGR